MDVFSLLKKSHPHVVQINRTHILMLWSWTTSSDRVWSTAFCLGTPRQTWSSSSRTRASRPQTPPCHLRARRHALRSVPHPAPCPTTTQPTPASPALGRKGAACRRQEARPRSWTQPHTQVCNTLFEIKNRYMMNYTTFVCFYLLILKMLDEINFHQLLLVLLI